MPSSQRKSCKTYLFKETTCFPKEIKERVYEQHLLEFAEVLYDYLCRQQSLTENLSDNAGSLTERKASNG